MAVQLYSVGSRRGPVDLHGHRPAGEGNTHRHESRLHVRADTGQRQRLVRLLDLRWCEHGRRHGVDHDLPVQRQPELHCRPGSDGRCQRRGANGHRLGDRHRRRPAERGVPVGLLRRGGERSSGVVLSRPGREPDGDPHLHARWLRRHGRHHTLPPRQRERGARCAHPDVPRLRDRDLLRGEPAPDLPQGHEPDGARGLGRPHGGGLGDGHLEGVVTDRRVQRLGDEHRSVRYGTGGQGRRSTGRARSPRRPTRSARRPSR